MICPKCATESGQSLFCYVCDTYLPSTSSGVKAGIPSRLGAYLLDGVIFLTVVMTIATVAAGIGLNVSGFYRDHGLEAFLLIVFAGALAYFGLFLWLLARGQTPGKWLMDVRAVDKRDGSMPGLRRMLLRETLGKWVSAFFLGLGWFWAIWDRDAQTWHDKIAGTVVLYKPTESRKLLAFALLCGALVLSIGFSWHSFSQALRTEPQTTGEPNAAEITATSQLLPTRTVLGFRFGESPADMGQRAGTLGFRLIDCQQRSADAPEYVDCKLVRDNGDSLTISFLHSRLQRLQLYFKIENYDHVLQAVKRDYGTPRVMGDGPLKGTAEWGSPTEGFDISLGKTADMTQGWLDAAEMPPLK